VRYEWTERFAGDWRRLSEKHRELFRAAVPEFSKACDAYVETGDVAVFPAHLRVKPITSAAGVFEMTWNFSGPDGRASFQWATITLPDGTRQAAVRWRRIGTHRIFGSP
jgi:hypothetical protein